MKEEFEFPMVPVSKKSFSKRKLVCGVGVNDAEYKTYLRVVGKTKICPYYQRWCSMIQRGYYSRFKEKSITYKDVTVCEEWNTFSTFKLWMEKQDWRGKSLDKDIIVPNNKVYSPETCAFVSSKVNNLLLNNGKLRGKHKQGVSFRESRGKFRADCSNGTGSGFLGEFTTEQLAYEAYVTYKHALILKVANKQEDIRIKNGLTSHANILLATLKEG